jgi:hypothetical protein
VLTISGFIAIIYTQSIDSVVRHREVSLALPVHMYAAGSDYNHQDHSDEARIVLLHVSPPL